MPDNEERTWISVNDRLPEDGWQVLIYSKRKDYRRLTVIVSPRRGMYIGDGDWIAVQDWDVRPTHWMPLPAPPEQVGSRETPQSWPHDWDDSFGRAPEKKMSREELYGDESPDGNE